MRQEDRRKEQMEYGSGRKKTVILAVVVLLLIAVMAGICSIKLKEITVTGNEKYTDEQLISGRCKPQYGIYLSAGALWKT